MVTSVTGYTADRMQAIEDNAIVDGEVVGDNLILTRYNATTINAGNVRGAVGPMNPDGNPAGTIIMGGWTANFTGYLILNGQTVVGGVAANPTVAAMYPGWVVGGNLVLPNTVGSVPLGGSSGFGVPTGSMTHVLQTTNMAPHQHTVDAHDHTVAHDHGTFQTVASGTHSHTYGGTSGGSSQEMVYRDSVAGSTWWSIRDTDLDGYANLGPLTYPGGSLPIVQVVTGMRLNYNTTHTHDYSGTTSNSTTHTHTVVVPNVTPSTSQASPGTNNGTGSQAPVDHTPRNFKVAFAVKTG